jgi:hypothetical protein
MTSSQESSSNARSAVFTDLDPFGSSKPRPYFDRKDLFATEVKSTSRQDSGSGPSSLTSNPPLPDFSKSNGTQSKPNPAAVSSQVDDPVLLENPGNDSTLVLHAKVARWFLFKPIIQIWVNFGVP